MARPRIASGEPSAKDRMAEAFWVALREKPFSKISVADISRIARVNRNAFYYHFDNMADLAHEVILNSLPVELFQSLLPGLKAGEAPALSMVNDSANEANFAKLRLLAGPHSTLELVGIVKESVIEAWLRQFGLQRSDLFPEDVVSITFIMGGMLDLLGNEDCFIHAAHPLQVIWSTPVVANALSSVPVLFENVANRGRNNPTPA